jgi:hypothetical protein
MHALCKRIIADTPRLQFGWVPREQNQEADALAAWAYREHRQKGA